MRLAARTDTVDRMIAKIIDVRLGPGRAAAFHRSQEIWNQESRRTDGYLGEYVTDLADGRVLVIAFWASRTVYENWMATEHDRIAALAGSDAHYESLTITIVDGTDQSSSVG